MKQIFFCLPYFCISSDFEPIVHMRNSQAVKVRSRLGCMRKVYLIVLLLTAKRAMRYGFFYTYLLVSHTGQNGL